MSETMFAVSSGEYSYYRVHFVCADRGTAEACVAKLNAGGAGREAFEIEEMPHVVTTDDIIIRPKHTARPPDSGYSAKYGDHHSFIEWCIGEDSTSQPHVQAHLSAEHAGHFGEAYRCGPKWEVVGQANGFPDEQSARRAMAEAEMPVRAQLVECRQWWDQNEGPCVLEGKWKERRYTGRCVTHGRDVDDQLPCLIAGVDEG